MKEELLEPVFRKIRIGIIKEHINNNMILCDIGCGDGSFLKYVSPYVLKGYGFDKKAEEKSFDNIVLSKYHIGEKIPTESDSVDCVTLIAVLEHLEKPVDVLNECNRILKKGGKIIMTTPAPVSKPILEFLSFRLHIVNPVEISDHKHYFTKDELRSILGDCGFTSISVKSFEFGLNNFAMGYKL